MNKEERFIIYDTKLHREVVRLSESDFRIYLAIHNNEDLIKELFDDYKPIVED